MQMSGMPRRLSTGNRARIRRSPELGDGDDEIAAGDHPEIPVAGLARVEEEGGVPVLARVAAILLPT